MSHATAPLLNVPTTHTRLTNALKSALDDLSVLSGDMLSLNNASWHDVAGIAAVNLRYLAALLDNARAGNCEPMLVFPSPADCVESV